MARRNRVCPAGVAQHVVQRGNNRQVCFHDLQDYTAYAYWLRQSAAAFGVAVHAWVFMGNHVHLLVTPGHADSVSGMMQHLGRCYVRYFNHRHARSGTLWEGRFRSCLVGDERYLLHCYRYIELNPVRAGMVAHPGDYRWSSYHANARGIESTLRTPHPAYLALAGPGTRAAAYRELFPRDVAAGTVERIREATRRGLAVGSDDFVHAMERTTGVRLHAGRRGRPRRDGAAGGGGG